VFQDAKRRRRFLGERGVVAFSLQNAKPLLPAFGEEWGTTAAETLVLQMQCDPAGIYFQYIDEVIE
jgi:hypothetical protein